MNMMRANGKIEIAPGPNPGAMQPVFARTGRLHIPDFFTAAAAEEITRALEAEDAWELAVVTKAKTFQRPLNEIATLSAADQAEIEAITADSRAEQMQYRFDIRPVSYPMTERRRQGGVLEGLCDYLNSPAFLQFVAALTGDNRATFVDMQATRYRPGHFLTDHNDESPGRHRLFAYVLNFSREWRPDWGGLLQFYAADGHVDEAYTPAFNALNIFRVPMKHAVSYVAPYAAADRLSVTGWIRTGALPKSWLSAPSTDVPAPL